MLLWFIVIMGKGELVLLFAVFYCFYKFVPILNMQGSSMRKKGSKKKEKVLLSLLKFGI